MVYLGQVEFKYDGSRSFNCAQRVVLSCASDLPTEEHALSSYCFFSMDLRINICRVNINQAYTLELSQTATNIPNIK